MSPTYLIPRNIHRELDKMRRQRNMFQTKEKETSGKELSQMEMSNPSDRESKITVIKMPIRLRRRMEEYTENINRDIENI